MLIQMCKISKVFSINFILIRCGSVPYNYKTENIFAVCLIMWHTTKTFSVLQLYLTEPYLIKIKLIENTLHILPI